MKRERVISRHRLPMPYRAGLVALWVLPLMIFIAAIVSQRGIDAALFDPRFVVPALVMLSPALYFWREGIDVLHGGIRRYIHTPRTVRFEEMARWHYDRREGVRVLTIWDRGGAKLVECRAAHLTDFPALLETLRERVG